MKLLSGPPMGPGSRVIKRNPAVFSIQHFCLHDGPGVRSIVFIKGCPLRCAWCQNPESWRNLPEAAFKAHLCIGCSTCVDVCPTKAISAPGIRDIQKCDECFACIENCPSGAMVCFGKYYTVDEILKELRPEFAYMQNTGGGVTFSGGEPTLFPEFIAPLSQRLHAEKIHTVLETCGYFDGEKNKRFLSDIDMVLFDIKLYDDALHKKFCGTSNAKIKENFFCLAAQSPGQNGPAVWPRLPLIPAVTDTTENLIAWAQLLKNAGISYLTLVPYHNLGLSKRQSLNLPPAPDIDPLTDDRLQASADLLEHHGISCFLPGEEDWTRAACKIKSLCS